VHRFASAGAVLRSLAAGSGDVWDHIDRQRVVSELCDRLRDPAIMRQQPTDLCGPFAVLVEFARRHPVRYVKGAGELLTDGTLTMFGGDVIHSEDDDFPPDHWVVYLGGLTPRNPGEDDTITLRLWSWAKEFTMSGTADSFGEYLYAVVTGRP